jgi:hypothetical protein
MKNTVRIVLATVGVTLLIVCAFLFILGEKQKSANFPFEVKYRKALTGSGYVDQIINTSSRVQSVKVTLNDPTFDRTRVYSIVVDAHQFREIGYLQGWMASSGDSITLEWNGVVKVFNIP